MYNKGVIKYTICSRINNAIDEDFSRVSHWLKGLRELRTHGKLMGPDLCSTVALTCFTTFFCRKRGKNRKKGCWRGPHQLLHSGRFERKKFERRHINEKEIRGYPLDQI